MTRILIADDHALVRDGLRRIIESIADFSVAGEAHSGDEAITKVHEGGFDVLLLDMSMPGKSGLDLIRHLRGLAPKLPILVLSMHAEDQYAVRAIRTGASGYLTKDSAPNQLVAAIRKVASGGVYISQAVAEQLASGLSPAVASGPPHTRLSDREHEVFLALVNGAGVSEIAEHMNVSVKTISTHKSRILEKMGLTGLADLVRYAVANHLVDDPDLPR
jgi:two-component system, NarL family, invasion response regulator UvrY